MGCDRLEKAQSQLNRLEVEGESNLVLGDKIPGGMLGFDLG